jgi:hypothetical protein
MERRQIINTQYAVNIDIVDRNQLNTLKPDQGALILTTNNLLYVGTGREWKLISFETKDR